MKECFGLTVAIVSFNSYDAICRCLDALLTSSLCSVILVDNASTDGSGKRIKEKYPNIELIQSERNLGYGRAANLALVAAKTEYLFLINPDLMAEPEQVKAIYRSMLDQKGKAVVLAPAVAKKDFKCAGVVAKDWVIGAAMMFNIELLKRVGFFDENIFLFSEETDLCYRICQSGMGIYLDTDIYIEHLYRQSSTPERKIENLKNWHFAWSRMYCYSKHGLAKGKRNPYRVLFVYAVKYIFSTKKTKREIYRWRMKGVAAFVRGEKSFLENGIPQYAPSQPT